MTLHSLDYLHIQDLKVPLSIGVFAWEKILLQTVSFDLKIFHSFQIQHDRLEEAIDYDKLTRELAEFLQSKHYHLIETLAEQTAYWILNHFKINAIEVIVKKPHAIKNAQFVAARVFREKTVSVL